MSAFSISETAAIRIRKVLKDSVYQDPVARLYERADGGRFQDLSAQLFRGERTIEQLESSAVQRFNDLKEHFEFVLMVGASDRCDYTQDDLLDIDQITFVLPAPVANLLAAYQLNFEDNRFFLRHSAGGVRSLQAILKAS